MSQYYVNRGEPCPACNGKRRAEVVAVLPIVIDGYEVDPDEYAICEDCHARQYEMKYGALPGQVPAPGRRPRSARTS